MSTFSCPVVRVASVENHPNADRLSIVKLEGLGYTCISAKLADGSPRYAVGDLVVYVPSASVLPEWLLRRMDFWNEELGKGTLAGSNGDRVKPMRLRGVFSDGVLVPVKQAVHVVGRQINRPNVVEGPTSPKGDATQFIVAVGDDASSFLGIIKYEPPIPVHLAGEVTNLFDHTIKYDFERLESVPDMFTPGTPVIASEKLHGTFCAIVYVPGLNHPEMFGEQGDILVHSKGLGGQGLVFKNNAANDGNLYVKNLRRLLDDGLENRLRMLVMNHPGYTRYGILGEIYGAGVQDLSYGTQAPEFRMFDVMVGDNFLCQDELGFDHALHGIPFAPVLYNGEFDLAALEAVRDGKTTVGGDNIREGIVVRERTGVLPTPSSGRRIAKMISPDYLTRKAKNATEYT